MENNNKAWLITGCSTGLGRAFATTALEAGYQVAVASRNTEDVKNIIKQYPETAFAVQLDVTKLAEIKAAVQKCFGYLKVFLSIMNI